MCSRSVKLEFLKNIKNQMCGDNFLKAKGIPLFKRRLSSATNFKHNFNLPQDEIRPFFTITQKLVKDINEMKICEEFPDLKNRITAIIEYPSKIGDFESPLTTFMAYKILEKPDNLINDKLNNVYLLGWFTEMTHGVLFMHRDAVDDVTIRNNKKTWHTDTEYSFQTPNDAVILETAIFHLLKRYFSKHKNYTKILDLFHETFYKSLLGHNLEIVNKDVVKFNMDLLTDIVKYKVAPNSYILPVMSAWYLTDNPELGNLEEVENILKDVAFFKKVHDDYLDSFGENHKNMNAKIGICSWLAIKSLEKGSFDQKTILKEHYGKPDTISTNRINSLYHELNLLDEFQNFKNRQYVNTNKKIEKISKGTMRKCLTDILNITFRISSS